MVITPTYSGCPAMGQIEDDVGTTLRAAGLQGRVVTQLAPAWTTDWMTDEAHEKLRAYGIAPPQNRCLHLSSYGKTPTAPCAPWTTKTARISTCSAA